MDPIQANPQMPVENKTCCKKTLVAIIALAIIAAGAYCLWSPKATVGEPVNSSMSETKELPALSGSDDVDSIKADLESTTVIDADFSPFDGEAEISAQ